MPEPKTQCSKCGAEILVATSERMRGFCVPCSEGRMVDRTPAIREREIGRSVDWQSIGILKDKESTEHADYFFESTVWDKDPRFKSRSMIVGTNRGLLRIYKDTGNTELLQPMPEDLDNKRFHRAAKVVRRHWEAGEYPKVTQFACG